MNTTRTKKRISNQVNNIMVDVIKADCAAWSPTNRFADKNGKDVHPAIFSLVQIQDVMKVTCPTSLRMKVCKATITKILRSYKELGVDRNQLWASIGKTPRKLKSATRI